MAINDPNSSVGAASKPVEIVDDDDDCTLIEPDLPDPIAVESDASGNEDGDCNIPTNVNSSVEAPASDAANAKDAVPASETGATVPPVSSETEASEKVSENADEGTQEKEKDKDRKEEPTSEVERSAEGTREDDKATDGEKEKVPKEEAMEEEVEEEEEEDPETKVMILRAMKESALETVTLENRKVAHECLSDKAFEHFLSVRVYMESDYGTGLPVRTDMPLIKIKEEPNLDVEEMLTGTTLTRPAAAADQKSSFGDAFSQFLTSASDGTTRDDQDEQNDEGEDNGEEGEANAQEDASEEEKTHEQEDTSEEEKTHAQEDASEEEKTHAQEAEPASETDAASVHEADAVDSEIPNGICGMKENHDSGIDVADAKTPAMNAVAETTTTTTTTKHLSDVPIDELLFDALQNSTAEIDFDDQLLN